MKKCFTAFFAVLMCIYVAGGTAQAKDLKNYWTKSSVAAEEIEQYVQTVTKKRSADFIPPESRIAVFDLDGTIMCDTYPRPFDWLMLVDFVNERGIRLPLAARSVAKEIEETYRDDKPYSMETQVLKAAVEGYKGLTPADIVKRVDKLKATNAEGFSGMVRGDAFYRPMCELINYLQENEFTVYVVCDTERITARALVSKKLGLPMDRVIGTDFSLVAGAQGSQSSDTYSMRVSDKLVYGGECDVMNVKMNKVTAIMREIGRQPVLAFGNDLADSSMLNYAVADNPYKSMSFMLINDDSVREYGDENEANELRQACTFNGWRSISMKKDFAEIYGKDVKKVRRLP